MVEGSNPSTPFYTRQDNLITMKTYKSLGTFIKEASSSTPNLTYHLNLICKEECLRHSRLKTVESVWNLFEHRNFTHRFLLTLSDELAIADVNFKSQSYDRRYDF